MMKKYTNWAVLQFDDPLSGNAQESAQVKVYLAGTTTEAAIFSDNGVTAITQPILTNTSGQENPGRFEFYVADGRYDIVINEGAADETNINNVSIKDGDLLTTDIINSALPGYTNEIRTTSGYTSAGDGGGAQWKHNGVTGQTASQTPTQLKALKLNDANGDQWELVQGSNSINQLGVETITLDIPTAFSSIQIALDRLSFFDHDNGQGVTLNLEAGFDITTGTQIESVDLSFVNITSVDAEVLVTAAVSNSTDIIKGLNSQMPTLDILVNANGNGRYGVAVQDNSFCTVSSGNGVKNTYGRGLYVNNNSMTQASGAVFTGAGTVSSDGLSRGAWVARGSTLIAESADFSSSEDVGVYVSRASTVHAMGLTATLCKKQAIWCHRTSRITAHYAVGYNVALSTHSSSTFDVVKIDRSSSASINGTGVTITQNGSGNGITSTGASITNVSEATIAGGASSGNGIEVSGSSSVDASSSVISGFDHNIDVNVASVAANLSTMTAARSHGIYTKRGGVSAASASVTGSTTLDINCLEGSVVHADSCTTTNGVGTPNLTDVNATAFNAITGTRGIIWS